MGLFHKENRIGTCEWCSVEGIPLTEYNDMLVCDGCRQELYDKREGVIERIEEGYQSLIDVFNRSGG